MARPRSIGLLFEPAWDVALAATDPDGTPVYDSLGDDPQFRVGAVPGLDAITPGWWRLRGRLHALDGAIIAPRFYPDHGAGLAEELCIPIAGDLRAGVVDSVVYVRAPIVGLRFDPTVRPARFILSGMQLTPLPRARAVAMMLARIAKGCYGSPALATHAAAGLARNGIRISASRAAAALYDEYVRADAHREGGYALWHRLFDPLQAELDSQAANALAGMRSVPAFALLVDARAATPASLRRCLSSLQRQSWPHWQARVRIDPAAHAARRVLDEYIGADPRITAAAECPPSLGASIAGLDADHVGFVQGDSELATQALCEAAYVLHHQPDAGLVYSDSDRIDSRGYRIDPHFKPEWNRTLLLAQDYIGHFCVVRSDVLAAAREVSMDAAGWHHDMVLRCTDVLSSDRIVHVPRVLYHTHSASVAAASGAGCSQAVRASLERRGEQAEVSPLTGGALRVTPKLTGAPTVTIIIPTRDRLALLRTCVESVLERTRYPAYEILVIDNASEEPETLDYLEALRGRPNCRVLPYPAAFNFSAITNAGVAASSSDIVCLLNNDIEVIAPDWLHELVAHAAVPDAGAVGAMLYYPDDTIQHGGVVLGIGGVAGHVHHRSRRGSAGHQGRARVAQELSAVTAACLAIRRDVFQQVGGFDESLAVAFNDIDFCLRVREAGYRNRWTPHAELYHHESASRGHEDTPDKKARFAREVETMKERWGDVLLNDPAYNPNLTMDWSNFELAFPPRVTPPAL